MNIGDRATLTRAFSAADVADYVRLGGAPPTGDELPEPLLHALISDLLGAKLPGFGTNYLKQDTETIGEARTGDALTATVAITRLRPEKHLVDLETIVMRADGAIVYSGRALVLVRDVSRRGLGGN